MEILVKTIKQEKEIKGIQTGRREVKLSLFADDMILYTEIPKVSTQKLLALTEFSKIPGYKINIEIHCIFYTNNEISERKSTKAIVFKITSKNNKILRINITKAVMDLDVENYKTLIKEIEDGV